MHVIYITGLGDKKVAGQKKAVSTWKIYGVTPHFFQMNWADKEPFEAKFNRLKNLVDELNEDGKQVGVVAVSAGATAALNLYDARKDKISGIVTICGKIKRLETIDQAYKNENPAFAESANLSKTALANLTIADKKKIMCIRPIFDEVVAVRDQDRKSKRLNSSH